MSDGIPPILGGDQQWRRLDARMLLVHPVQEAVRFFPALLVVFFSGRSSGRSGWWDWAILGLIVALGMSRWFTTRYRIWGGQIELRRGLLNRRLLTTPADRVRTVDVTAPVWHRLLGLAKVEIGTAGAGIGAERIVFDALAAPVAARLRGELLHRAAAQPTDQEPGATNADPMAAGPDSGVGDDPGVVLPTPSGGRDPHRNDGRRTTAVCRDRPAGRARQRGGDSRPRRHRGSVRGLPRQG